MWVGFASPQTFLEFETLRRAGSLRSVLEKAIHFSDSPGKDPGDFADGAKQRYLCKEDSSLY